MPEVLCIKIRKAIGFCHFICFKVLRKKNVLRAQRGQLNEMRKVYEGQYATDMKEYEPQGAKRRVFMGLKRLNEMFSKKGKKVFFVCSILFL